MDKEYPFTENLRILPKINHTHIYTFIIHIFYPFIHINPNGLLHTAKSILTVSVFEF